MKRTKNISLFVMAALAFAFAAAMSVSADQAPAKPSESYYQELWCNQEQGVIEYVLEDRTRVDCLTKTHAIEFDFARKWAEAIGQALHYSAMTGLEPGIALIIETDKDMKYWERLKNTLSTKCLKIKLWCIGHESCRVPGMMM